MLVRLLKDFDDQHRSGEIHDVEPAEAVKMIEHGTACGITGGERTDAIGQLCDEGRRLKHEMRENTREIEQLMKDNRELMKRLADVQRKLEPLLWCD